MDSKKIITIFLSGLLAAIPVAIICIKISAQPNVGGLEAFYYVWLSVAAFMCIFETNLLLIPIAMGFDVDTKPSLENKRC